MLESAPVALALAKVPTIAERVVLDLLLLAFATVKVLSTAEWAALEVALAARAVAKAR